MLYSCELVCLAILGALSPQVSVLRLDDSTGRTGSSNLARRVPLLDSVKYGFTDGHPTLPTFRTTTGETCLDRTLLPTAFLHEPTA